MTAIALAVPTTVSVIDFFTVVTVQGSVQCASHAPVQGVWVETSIHTNSGMASVGVTDPGAGARFTWTGRTGGSYQLHIGCGGTSQQWAVSGYSNTITNDDANIVCDDVATVAHQSPFHTRCSSD